MVVKCVLLSFTAKVGGWMGLAIGASCITFLELFYFLWLLLKTSFRFCCGSRSRGQVG